MEFSIKDSSVNVAKSEVTEENLLKKGHIYWKKFLTENFIFCEVRVFS